MPGVANENKQLLHDAFDAFNEVSDQLARSYSQLEARVANLNDELARAQGERVKELIAKERMANRLQSLLTALPAGVVVLDGKGVIQETNPAAVELLGEPLLGQAWRDVIARTFAPRVDDGHDISLRDGRRVNLSTQSLGNEPGQILLLRDVTETRELQERLNRHKRLSDMGEMAATLAHQIRTPLASALLYSSHLLRDDLAAADHRRFVGKLRAGLHQLENQVNDMLMFARGGSTGSDEIVVGEFLHSLRNSMEAQLERSGGQCRVEEAAGDISLTGNREALLSAMQNLVNNAIDACGSDCAITLSAQSMQQHGMPAVLLSVRDNGPGIEADKLGQVFEPFFTTRSRGTGLGLAVVKAVVHAHNGTVWIESEAGNGSCVKLLIPINPRSVLRSGTSSRGSVKPSQLES